MLSVLWARSQFTLTASAFCLFAYHPSVLSLQWLEAGLGFPAGGKSTKSWPLHQRSVTRALALRLCRKEFPQRQKAVKPMKYLLRRKKSTECVERHMGRLRQRESLSHTLMAVWITCMGHFFQVSQPIVQICLVHSPHLVYLDPHIS